MPAIFPFRAVQYHGGRGDVSKLICPPYDVLDAKMKAHLLKHEPHNAVAVDLPHVPAKEAGPPETYLAAASKYGAWVKSGALAKREKPAMFAYRQTFTFRGREHQRCGLVCTVETLPFGPREGGGVLAHEETFSGPKEDRFALMKASRTQFSPIFGLHPDEKGAATKLARSVMAARAPDMTGRMEDNVLHEVWTIDDDATIEACRGALAGEDVFIADGHHRYTTALNYLKLLEQQGRVAQDHPARRCMMVLVSMSDPGLVIGPTHRVLGGMKNYSFPAFVEAAAGQVSVSPGPEDLHQIEGAVEQAARGSAGRSVLGLIDFEQQRAFVATFNHADPLAERFPKKPEAWRRLDVALTQHVIVEGICQPRLNGGQSVQWAFPHSVEEVLEIGRGHETGAGGGKAFKPQLAVIVRPTPLEAVRDVSRANELMPQKSTFFYPKLATGLFFNPLE